MILWPPKNKNEQKWLESNIKMSSRPRDLANNIQNDSWIALLFFFLILRR